MAAEEFQVEEAAGQDAEKGNSIFCILADENEEHGV